MANAAMANLVLPCMVSSCSQPAPNKFAYGAASMPRNGRHVLGTELNCPEPEVAAAVFPDSCDLVHCTDRQHEEHSRRSSHGRGSQWASWDGKRAGTARKRVEDGYDPE